MRNPFQSDVRRPWLLLSAALLLCYSMLPLAPGDGLSHGEPGSLVEIFMFLLALPLSLFGLLALSELGTGLATQTQWWAFILALNYFQWFHLVPIFLRWRNAPPAITLNLAADGGVASPNPAPAPAAAAYASPRSLGAADAPPVPQFNERGRTPLERVFDET